jgi:hypothetical protein
VRLYQVFCVFASHFLNYSSRMTSLNWCKGIIPILWILKKLWTRDGLHGPIQWICITTVTSNISPIFKSWTWRIDGNVSRKQTYLFNSIITVRSSMRPILLSRTKIVHTNVPIHIEWRAPKFLVWPKKGPKSWICRNGQKLGAAPSFQH